jgi:hypothetical protein
LTKEVQGSLGIAVFDILFRGEREKVLKAGWTNRCQHCKNVMKFMIDGLGMTSQKSANPVLKLRLRNPRNRSNPTEAEFLVLADVAVEFTSTTQPHFQTTISTFWIEKLCNYYQSIGNGTPLPFHASSIHV